MSSRIPQHLIQEIISRTDIIDIIGDRIPLRKQGQNHSANCPFHKEKSPSFTVSQAKQFFYCFGCGKTGNAIGFLMAFEHMEFVDAVSYLALQLGIEISHEQNANNSISSKQDDLYSILHQASQFYQTTLRQSTNAINYLKSRGLDGQTCKNFGVGYAPAGWNNLQTLINHTPQSQSMFLANGLIIDKKNNQFYDRFRDRIMFPIHNTRGQIVGFGGRSLGDALPKYMNSPETPIFHKSDELYGLYFALKTIDKLTQIVVVEGYMDVISLHQHHINYAVATLGTAIAGKQIQKLLRHTHKIIFCFDGDEAGKQAAWKALLSTLPFLYDGTDIRFLFLPQNEDPDSLVRKIGSQQFAENLASATPITEVLFKKLGQEIPLDSMSNKAYFIKQVNQYIEQMPNSIFQQLLMKELAKIVKMEINEIKHLMQSSSVPAQETLTQKATPLSEKKLPPAYLATLLLLHKSELATHINDVSSLYNIQAPGINILIKVLTFAQKQPNLTIGELLNYLETSEEQQVIARLATRELCIPDSGFKNEFLWAINQVFDFDKQQQIKQLIDKSKSFGLSQTEKEALQALLAYKLPPSDD